MDEIEAHTLFGQWSEDRRARGVFIDADFAPDDEAIEWVDALFVGALAAMAEAGVRVGQTELQARSGRIYAILGGEEILVRDIDSGAADTAIPRLLGHLDEIAAARERRERWNVFYEGDPAGMAYFVAPEELFTSTGMDVRDLDVGITWFRVARTPEGFALSAN